MKIAGVSIRKVSVVEMTKWLEPIRQQGGDKEPLIYDHSFNTIQKDMVDRCHYV